MVRLEPPVPAGPAMRAHPTWQRPLARQNASDGRMKDRRGTACSGLGRSYLGNVPRTKETRIGGEPPVPAWRQLRERRESYLGLLPRPTKGKVRPPAEQRDEGSASCRTKGPRLGRCSRTPSPKDLTVVPETKWESQIRARLSPDFGQIKRWAVMEMGLEDMRMKNF